MKSRLKVLLIIPTLFTISSLLLSCNVNTYDQHFWDLIERAKHGDISASREAYDYCTAFLKLDASYYPAAYLGQCGGLLAIERDIAMESGDPEDIMLALNKISVIMKNAGQYNMNALNLPNSYLSAAKAEVIKSCSFKSRPNSCYSRDVMSWYDLPPTELH